MSPYKDPERQKQAQREHYLRNKDAYRATQRRLRAQPGYRDDERRKEREKLAADRALRPPKPAPRPRRVSQLKRIATARERKLTPDEIVEQQRIQEMIDRQREMKAAALRRLGLGS